MPTVKLKCIRDRETGELGLVVRGMKVSHYPSAANEGLLIAHDLIEHVNGIAKIGSIDDELEALGGVWFTRGHISDIRRDGRGSMVSAEDNLASDVINLARIYNDGVNFRSAVPRTRSHLHDDAFNEIIRLARDMVSSEIDEEYRNAERLDAFFSAALHYLRSGFNKAKCKHGTWQAANCKFWNIAEAVDPHAKRPEFEGMEYRLTYSRDDARCEPIYDDTY
jgi:hypothetical protein